MKPDKYTEVSDDFIIEDKDVSVIEEPLQYSDIDSTLEEKSEKQKRFESYLREISSGKEPLREEISDITKKPRTRQTPDTQDTPLTLGAKLKKIFRRGIISRFLLGYNKHDSAIRNSTIIKSISKRERSDAPSPLRRFAIKLDDSFIFRSVRYAVNRIVSLPSRYFGAFFLSYAICSFIIYFIGLYTSKGQYQSGLSYLIYGMVTMIVATFLVTGDYSIIDAFTRSPVLRFVFVNFLGYRLADKEAGGATKSKLRYMAIFAAAGALVALSALFVSAGLLWSIVILAIFLLLSVSSPEFCFNVTLLILPFTVLFERKTLPIALLTMLCLVCYLRKLLLKKRAFEFEPLDFYVLLFALIYFISGITTIGQAASFAETFMHLMLICGYFLASNLLKSERTLMCTNKVLTFSTAAVSIIGIVEFISGKAQVKWIDTSVFGTDNGRIVSTMQNPNTLAVYLLFSIPFLMANIKRSRRSWSALLRFICLCIAGTALVLTQSRAGYIALAFSVIAMFLYFAKNSLTKILAFLAAVPYFIMVLPHYIQIRFISIFSAALDSSVSYRTQIWEGCMRLIPDYFLIGIGGGSSAFSAVYPAYATAGAEAAPHAHNIFLQCMVETGIVGTAAFIFMLLIFVQMNSSDTTKRDRGYRPMQVAGFVAIISQLIFGATDYIWHDKRMLFLFFVVMGISVVSRRFNSEKSSESDHDKEQDRTARIDKRI